MKDTESPNTQQKSELVVRYRNVVNRSLIALSLVGTRILQTAIAKLVKDPQRSSESVMYYVSAAELAEQGGNLKSAYAQLQDAEKELRESEIVWRNLDDADISIFGIKTPSGKPLKRIKGTLAFRWFTAVNYDYENGRIGLVFNPQLIPCFDQLTEQFTRYALSDLQGLTSTYPIRLYGMLMQFSDTGILDVSVKDLRERLLNEDILNSYGDFKRRVIVFSVNQINSASNSKLHVDFEEKRVGRKVERIIFRFTRCAPRGPQQEVLDLVGGDPIGIDVTPVVRAMNSEKLNYRLTKSQRVMFADWLTGCNLKKNKEINYDPSAFITFLYSNKLCEDGTFANSTSKEIAEKVAALLGAPSFVKAIYQKWLVPFGVKLKVASSRRGS